MDHNVDGRVLMPATSYVVTAWEAAAAAAERPLAEFPAAFADVAIHQAVVATHGQKVTLAVQLAPAGKFYVRAPALIPIPRILSTVGRRSCSACSWRRPASSTCAHALRACCHKCAEGLCHDAARQCTQACAGALLSKAHLASSTCCSNHDMLRHC